MSKATPKACIDCGQPAKEAVCPRCQAKRPARGFHNHDGSGSNVARGYGSDWQRARAIVLFTHPRCQYCERMPSTEVDHLIPKYKGGTDDIGNLRACCHECHKRKSKAEWILSRRKQPQPIEAYER